MKTVVAALVGPSGSGTAALAAHVAAILNWPFASFGAYVRAEAARRGLSGTRDELQNVGLELVSADLEGFCRAVVELSQWRPGQSLVVDGIRHKEVLDFLKKYLAPTIFIMVRLEADTPIREERLREKGEALPGGIPPIDRHPVEAQVITVLPELTDISLDARLSEPENADAAVEFLMDRAGIPPTHSWVTRDMLVRIPRKVRAALGLRPGDLFEVGDWNSFLVGLKIVDEERIHSVVGRLREQLEGVDPVSWVRAIRASGEDAEPR